MQIDSLLSNSSTDYQDKLYMIKKELIISDNDKKTASTILQLKEIQNILEIQQTVNQHNHKNLIDKI